MIRILSSKQIREADQFTIAHEPISSIDLMERAANSFCSLFLKKFHLPASVSVFCGSGNNGGDGLAIARILTEKGCVVSTYLLAETGSDDFMMNLQRLRVQQKVSIHNLKNEGFFPALENNTIIIDALFGTGLNKPLGGLAKKLVEYLNTQPVQRVAVDVPSGLYADKPADGITFHAHYTVTFQFPKLSFFFAENEISVGAWEATDIGLHPEYLSHADASKFLIEKKDVQSLIRPRKKFDHKGTFGHALIVAGSTGKMGAALLAAKACVRSGAGLTSLHVPAMQVVTVHTSIPEVMVSIDEGADVIQSVPELKKYAALGLGPGLGTTAKTKNVVFSILKKKPERLVIDADALNIIASRKNGIDKIPVNAILTPHPKEFQRLAGSSDNWLERHELQLKLSGNYNIYIVLKGAYTCISSPDGKCYFNPTGNPGMAKGGSGDVLTGIITSFLAQRYTPLEACISGVYLHGLAGDLAAESESVYSMLASDIIDHLSAAFKNILE